MTRAVPFAVCFVLAAAATPAQEFRMTRNATIPSWPVGSDGTYDLALGDVDGDLDLDLVVARDHDPNLLLQNDGRGSFVDATAGRLVTPTTPQPPQGFANATYEVDLVDIDGDLDLDLLMVNDHYLRNRVYTNDGLGWFTDVTTTALPPHAEWSIDQVVADFDNDGDADWLVVNSTSMRLYRNDGTGTFTDISATHLAPFSGSTYSSHAFAVDLDADGDLDVVLPGASHVLVNQGGVLSPWSGTLPGSTTGSLVFAADVDADGLPDLFVDNGRRLLRNAGGMVFVDVTAGRLPAGWTGRLYACADTDLDADLDAIGNGVVLHNDGAGTFTLAGSATPTATSSGAYGCLPKLADLDDDGDPDLVFPDPNQQLVPWMNFLCQVQTPVPPTLGQTYPLEFHAPVRSTPVVFGPAGANAGAFLPLPPYGNLRLDLTQGAFMWALPTTTGLHTHVWSIPNLPLLLGIELHYQAVVFDPLRAPFLTNAVRDVIQ